jgi:L-threonylcarbamoyladenylate synthase
MEREQIQYAAQIIKQGGVVAFPTETVYGLGANALNPIAVAKIFALKERPSFDPLIVHIASIDEIKLLTDQPTDLVFKLAEKFWPGPLTIVLAKSSIVPDIVTSGLQTVGIRMPDNQIALNLIQSAGCPLAAPSANKFGNLSPVLAKHVKKQLPDVDFILDGGQTTIGIESTIVSIEGNKCTMLRPGKITLEDINHALPGVFDLNSAKPEKIIAPGLLQSHYSPAKPLFIYHHQPAKLPDGSGLILHSDSGKDFQNCNVLYTSKTGNLLEVAANLFSALHSMEDNALVNQIFIEPVVEQGVGIAIMDRIKKAAFRYGSFVKQ